MFIHSQDYDFYGEKLTKTYTHEDLLTASDRFKIEIDLTLSSERQNISSILLDGKNYIPDRVEFPTPEEYYELKNPSQESILELPSLAPELSRMDTFHLFGIYLGSTNYFKERNYWEKEVDTSYFYYPTLEKIRKFVKNRDTDFHFNSKNNITYKNTFYELSDIVLPQEIIENIKIYT